MSVAQGLEQKRLKQIELQARELARAKEELERLDEAKSRLMLKVAHELRAPVAAVAELRQPVPGRLYPEQEIKPTLSRIQERLQEMLDLTADLLELAPPEAGQGPCSALALPRRMLPRSSRRS